MSQTRLYVSGPMSGLPEYNFPAFHAAARKLRRAGYLVTSPHEVKLPCGCSGGSGCGPDPHVWSDYLRADLLAMLADCTAVATLPGIEGSRGAKLEIAVAEGLGWPVQPVGHWLGETALAQLSPGQLLRARPVVPPPPPPYRISNPEAS